MTAAEALARLRRLGLSVVTTANAATLLQTSPQATSNLLSRLASAGLLLRVTTGLWALDPGIDPLRLPEVLTAPFPSYVSLQTALYRHGMLSQMPALIYAISLDRRRTVRTAVGAFSIHRVAPEFFGGFEATPEGGVKLATPEKALLDVFYLTPTSTRLFSRLPELELPRSFRVGVARRWIGRVSSPRLRTIMSRRLEEVLRARA